MNRAQEIEHFLQYYAQVYSQNPNLEITDDTIYNAMTNYALRNDERENPDIRGYFDHWIKNFKASKNLLVYHDERQRRFLQFHNIKNYDETKYIKIYLNYPKECIYDCTNKIFDFINKNDIKNCSKVADRVRSDSVVLRINSIEEANKVIDFINNDYELSTKARLTSPFAYRHGVCAIAYDDRLSYNSIVSNIITSYLNNCRINNRFNCVSFEDFKFFVNNLYQTQFKDVNGIKNYAYSQELALINRGNRHKGIEDIMLNVEQIYKTFAISLNENSNLNDIMKHINNCKNEYNNDQMKDYYKAVVNNQYYSKPQYNPIDKKSLIDSYIEYNISKYGPVITYDQINRYINGDVAAITRDNNFRSLFSNNINYTDIMNVTNSDIKGYIDLFSNSKGYEKIDQADGFDFSKSRQVLNAYISQHVFWGYSPELIQNNLLLYMNGNKDVLPDNLKNAFLNYVPPGVIIRLTGPDIESYIKSFYQMNTGQAGMSR